MANHTFHLDEADRVEGERHAGIIIKSGKILLIHRIRDGWEYWVLPGGHRRNSESGVEGLIREIYEETGNKVSNPVLLHIHKRPSGSKEFNYICRWKSGGKPELIGEEAIKNSAADSYDPGWIELSLIPQINLLPEYLKPLILKIKSSQDY